MLLKVNRITGNDRIVQLQIRESITGFLSAKRYTIERRVESTGKVEVLIDYETGTEDSRLTISYENTDVLIEIADEMPLNGTAYTYVVYRSTTSLDPNGVEIVEVQESNRFYIESIPSKVSNFYIKDTESIYDTEIGIPTRILLKWDDYDFNNNNLDVIGFNILYSTSHKGENDWSPWEKVKDLTTSGGVLISNIDKSETSAIIYVPQLSDRLNPKDMRFALVAITANIQSSLSDVDVIASYNVACGKYYTRMGSATIINGSVEDTDKQVYNGRFIDPHYIVSINGDTFDEDTSVWIERVNTTEYKDGVATIEYEMMATSKVVGAYDLEYYIPLESNISVDVRSEDESGNLVSVVVEYDAKRRMYSFSLNSACRFVVVLTNNETTSDKATIYHSTFSEITRKMIKRLPTWFKIRRNPTDSIGAYFLEVFGLEMQDIEKALNYAYEQTHVATLDNSQIGVLYKASLPYDIVETDTFFVVGGDGTVLEHSPNLKHFLKEPYFLSEEELIYHNNMFAIDYNEKVIYTRRMFPPCTESQYGVIDISIQRDGNHKPLMEQVVPLEQHKLWNFFDEFGMLLDLTRLKNESNKEFKERILDVFKNPSSSSKIGLMNGIARELGIRKNVKWTNYEEDFVIEDHMVICNMITVNGERLPLKDIWFDANNNIVIKAIENAKSELEVSYVSGLTMHSLNNENDIELRNKLFQPNGLATELLRRYVSRIKDNIPIEWDSFKWNEGYWDANLPENGGIACIPSLMDASISGFENH